MDPYLSEKFRKILKNMNIDVNNEATFFVVGMITNLFEFLKMKLFEEMENEKKQNLDKIIEDASKILVLVFLMSATGEPEKMIKLAKEIEELIEKNKSTFSALYKEALESGKKEWRNAGLFMAG